MRRKTKEIRVLLVVALTILVSWFFYMGSTNSFHEIAGNLSIAITMIVGSFVAGATSEGGGAVAFPVLTLLLKVPASVARDFSIAIQSAGMMMAALTIYLLRIRIFSMTILPTVIGAMVGFVFSTSYLINHIDPKIIKVFYVSVWACFASVMVFVSRFRSKYTKELNVTPSLSLIVVGMIGGVVVGLVGSGIDIFLFAYLILFKRADPKVATPTSVVVMGFTSFAGLIYRVLGSNSPIEPIAWEYFRTCLPIVIFGAPLGAIFITMRTRRFVVTLLIVSLIVQYLFALAILPLGFSEIIISVGAVLVFSLVLLVQGRTRLQ